MAGRMEAPQLVARVATAALAAMYGLQSCRFPEETIACDTAADCTAGRVPRCEDSACTYVDEEDTCPSGRRYGSYSTGKGACVPADGGAGSGGSGGMGAGGKSDVDGGGGAAAGGAEPDGGGAPSATLRVIAGRIGGMGTADGRGSLARFVLPGSLAFDGERYLYMPDNAANTIRRIDTRNAEVTTYAGSPDDGGHSDGTLAEARFSGPESVLYDGSTRGAPVLFVTEWDSNRVRRIDMTTGVVTTIAGAPNGESGRADGTGTAARLDSPEDAVRGAGSTLYVADSGNNTIRSIDLATLNVTTVAGDAAAGTAGSTDGPAAAARFDHPYGLAFDGARNRLFIGEYTGQRLRILDLAAGTVSTLTGEGLGGIASLYYDAPGDRLFAPSFGSGKLLEIDVAQKTSTPLIMQAGPGFEVDPSGSGLDMDGPVGVVRLANGTFFVSEYGGATVRKMVPTGADYEYEVTRFAGLPSRWGRADGTGPAARFDVPTDLLFAPDDVTLYVLDHYNDSIRTVNTATGATVTYAGGDGHESLDGVGPAARFMGPEAMTLGPAAAGQPPPLYVAEENAVVRMVDTASAMVSTLHAGNAEGATDAPYFRGIAANRSAIYLSSDSYRIYQMPLAGGVPAPLAGDAMTEGCADGPFAAARFKSPEGLIAQGESAVFVADAGCHTIRKIDLEASRVTTVVGDGKPGTRDGSGIAARFVSPARLAWDRAGTGFYVTDEGLVRHVTVDTMRVKTVAGDPAARLGVWLSPQPPRLNRVLGVAEGPEGELYLTSENAVLRFDPAE